MPDVIFHTYIGDYCEQYELSEKIGSDENEIFDLSINFVANS